MSETNSVLEEVERSQSPAQSRWLPNVLYRGAAIGLAALATGSTVGCADAAPSQTALDSAPAAPLLQETGAIAQTDLETVINVAQKRFEATAEMLRPGLFPYATNQEGIWKERSGPNGWVAGFFPGSLWLMYEQTGDSRWKQLAEKRTAPIKLGTVGERDHEIGLAIIPSYGNGYETTHDPAYKKDLLSFAETLASRYNPAVKALGSLVEGSDGKRFRIIMDNTTSLELLFWAAKNGGKPEWYDEAVQHAETVEKTLVRPDGRVFQDAVFDPHTGKLERQFNSQGYSDTSTWSRGQAWAIAGFTTAYQETGDPQFLQTARLVSDYFINHLPSDKVPYYDFQAPHSADTPRDSSAAAVAASYLFELSTLDPDADRQTTYFEAAQSILASLISPKYFAKKGDALLAHATQNIKQHMTNTGLVYGDYYLMQAILRYEKITGRNDRLTDMPIGLADQ